MVDEDRNGGCCPGDQAWDTEEVLGISTTVDSLLSIRRGQLKVPLPNHRGISSTFCASKREISLTLCLDKGARQAQIAWRAQNEGLQDQGPVWLRRSPGA